MRQSGFGLHFILAQTRPTAKCRLAQTLGVTRTCITVHGNSIKRSQELLNRFATDFGLDRVEGTQSIAGLRSSTTWTIDAKGILENGQGILIIECRQSRRKKQVQEQAAALAYRILDTGAEGAIIVSPLGLQIGAQKIASAEGIIQVHLNPDNTSEEFAMRFLNRLYVSIVERVNATDMSSATLGRLCSECGLSFQVIGLETKCQRCASAA